jgi:hypothetical protein
METTMTPFEKLKAAYGWIGLVFILAIVVVNLAARSSGVWPTVEERHAQEQRAYEQDLAIKKAGCTDGVWDDGGHGGGVGWGWKNHCWRGEELRKKQRELASDDCPAFLSALGSYGMKTGSLAEQSAFCATQRR